MATSTQNTEKRIVFTQGGKGGVGKTLVATLLLDFYKSKGLTPEILDFDTENKNSGGLSRYYPKESKTVNISKRDGLDALVRACGGDSQVIFADMGAGAGEAAFQWFDDMADSVADLGIGFTSIGLATNDASSISSVLRWGSYLGDRVKHVVALNELSDPQNDFSLWNGSKDVENYLKKSKAEVIKIPSLNPELQQLCRGLHETIGTVADKKSTHKELQDTVLIMRAQAARRRIFAEFDRIIEALLP